MPRLIKNGQIVDDAWQTLVVAEGQTADSVALPEAPTLLPLSVWQARRDEILARAAEGADSFAVGVWLDAGESPEAIADDLTRLAVVAIRFPKFTDGRGYSTARLLRERYSYSGELRAIGDVLHDQLFLMARCGFDAFALKDGKDVAKAVNAFETFKTPYQAAVDQTQPLFRRRAA